MKNLLMIVMLMNFVLPGFCIAEEAAEGHVYCGTKLPFQKGFRLIELRNENFDFTGEFILDGLRFSGEYNPYRGALDLTIYKINDRYRRDRDSVMLESRTPLTTGEFWRIALFNDESPIELYCSVNWSAQ